VSPIEAVVFDLDGVLLDSEHVWDEVREQLVRERGGRCTESAQADMMGISSTEGRRHVYPSPPATIAGDPHKLSS
jgi:beta-phosphoglucomutase-like phosphatase (HAD superfamily)